MGRENETALAYLVERQRERLDLYKRVVVDLVDAAQESEAAIKELVVVYGKGPIKNEAEQALKKIQAAVKQARLNIIS